MKRKTLLPLTVLILLLVAHPGLAHEGHNEAFGGGEAASPAASRVEIAPEGQKAIGLQVQTVKLGALAQELQATGQVQAAENRAYDINPPANGVVRQVYVSQGDAVSKGQPIATLYSPEVAQTLSTLLQEKAKIQAQIATNRTQAQRDVAVTQKALELNRVNYLREEKLLQEGITARKDYIQAKNAYETSQVELAAIQRQAKQQTILLQQQLNLTVSAVKSQLNVLGLSDLSVEKALAHWQVSSTLPIVSPVSGIVTFRDATPGETLPSSKRIFSIVNLQPIWVIIHVFQDQLSQIQLGQTVRMVTPTRQTVLGKISNLGTVVDPEQRTLAVRVVSENNAGLLKPGMFIQAAIVTGQSQQGHLIIPNSALIDDAGKTLVYVKQGNAFIPTTVQLGKRTAQAVEVLDGLYPGDQIVITGVTQIHAQALLSQNTAKAQKESGSTTTQSPEAGSPPGYDWLTLGGGILLGFATALLGFGGWRWLRRRPSRPGRR